MRRFRYLKMVPEQSEEREPCSSVEPTGRTDTVSIPWSLVLREVAERELSHERRWYHVIRHHVLRNEGVVSFFVETFPQEEDDEMAEALVLQSDFGVSDGAVSAMYGVAHSINPEIRIFDLTHDIPPFHIWEASYRLLQTGRTGRLRTLRKRGELPSRMVRFGNGRVIASRFYSRYCLRVSNELKPSAMRWISVDSVPDESERGTTNRR